MSRRKITPVYRRAGQLVVSIAICMGLLLSAMYGYWRYIPAVGAEPDVEGHIISLPYGTPKSKIYQLAEESGMVCNRYVFRALDYAFGGDKSFLAGEYRVTRHFSMRRVAELLRSSDVVRYDLVIPEGWTVKQITTKLESIDLLEGAITDIPDEGSLFPAVYHYARGDSRMGLVAWMTRRMDQELQRLWQMRDNDFPLKNQKEWLTLASLIEREAGLNQERRLIASVFLNRLRLGYRLQSDPTVVYQQSKGLGTLGRKLGTLDLKVDGPYNTYRRYGLPVGPIANPGRESLLAVIQPARSNFLYFVANGQGGHRFAESLKEHNRNVAIYRRYLRDQARENNK